MRRVLVARGGALSPFSGLGGSHARFVNLLSSGDFEDYSLTDILEYPEAGNSLTRAYRRWSSHPKRVAKAARKGHAQILHITDQEQAHLVPKNCPIPVVVFVHDMFHLVPTIVDSGKEMVEVGDHNPSRLRKYDMRKLRKGLSRANLFICNSPSTAEIIEEIFPNIPAISVPYCIDLDLYDPHKNLRPKPDWISEDKMNLLIVGSEEPRKRLDFAIEAVALLPDEIRSQVVIHKIGAESSPTSRKQLEDLAAVCEVELNWLGRMEQEALYAAYQHTDGLLFPSCAEGFGLPAVEALAAGTWSFIADFPAHNMHLPEGLCLPKYDRQAWADAIEKKFHESREINEESLELAHRYSNESFTASLSKAWNSLFD
jgi:glycosyltransferase involved in cell wall biosynthesis